MNTAVRCTVGVLDETRLAYRAVGGDERRQRVARIGELYLGIALRAGAADCRECVARGARVGIESRPQSIVGYIFHFLKCSLAIEEHRLLRGCKARHLPTGGGGAWSGPGIGLRANDRCKNKEKCRRVRNRCAKEPGRHTYCVNVTKQHGVVS